MSQFRFILNDTVLTDQPDGWKDFTEAIVRDGEVFGITIEYKQDLTFAGEGYSILEAAFQDSACEELELVIEERCSGAWEESTRVLIKTSDITVNINTCTVECKTTDNTYYGLIHNNRKVPVKMITNQTKNGDEMDPATEIDVEFFEPEQSSSQISFYGTARKGFDAIDALETVLTFITNGEITQVDSDFYNQLQYEVPVDSPAYDYGDMSFAFFSGKQLRAAGDTDLKLTFEDIMKTLNAMYGLWWRVSDGVVILEPESYFYSEDSIQLSSLRDVTRETDTRRLYSHVLVGSPKTEDENFVSNTYPDPINWSMPTIDLISHSKQEYPLSGVCNTDEVLNLVPAHVIDSNLIEKTVYIGENTPSDERPDQDADSDVFFVQIVRDETNARWLTCWSNYFLLSTSPVRGYTYNPALFNSEVIKRHSVQSDYSLYYTGDDDKFRVSLEAGSNTTIGGSVTGTFPSGGISGDALNTAYGSISGVGFNDDSTDPNFNNNNNFDLVTDVYDVPATSVYGLESQLYIKKVIDNIIRSSNPSEVIPIQDVPNADSFNYVTCPVLLCQILVDIVESNGTTIALTVPMSNHFILDWSTSAGQVIQFGTFNVPDQTGYPVQWNTQLVRSTDAQNLGINTGQWAVAKETPVGSAFVYALSGQKLRVRLNMTIFPHYANVALDVQRQVRYAVQNDSWFRCSWILATGGSFESVNPNLHRALLYNFDRPLTRDVWNELKADPTLAVEITPTLDNFITTHIDRVERNLSNAETTFELIGNRDQTTF